MRRSEKTRREEGRGRWWWGEEEASGDLTARFSVRDGGAGGLIPAVKDSSRVREGHSDVKEEEGRRRG